MLIDTHCHIHDREKFPEPGVAVEEASRAGVERIVVVGVNPEDWENAIELAERFEQVFAIVGWHPNYTADYAPGSLNELVRIMAHPKVLALGEIGLDYHWSYSPRETQLRALRDQLELAADLGRPVVFHARDATTDLLDLLESGPAVQTLLHCFMGSEEDALRAAEMGSYFGIDGPITYKRSDELRRIAALLPPERLVLETDSPYLSPEPYRGKTNQPANLTWINLTLSQVLGMPSEACAEMTSANAVRFFGSRLAEPLSART